LHLRPLDQIQSHVDNQEVFVARQEPRWCKLMEDINVKALADNHQVVEAQILSHADSQAVFVVQQECK
jgi:hypothetical protein